MLKDFITSQKSFNKIVEEKLEKLDNLVAKVDNLSHEVDFIKIIFLPHDVKEHKTLNAIQYRRAGRRSAPPPNPWRRIYFIQMSRNLRSRVHKMDAKISRLRK